MLRGHVFVVNENTLPKHLEYQFVGVGAKDKDSNISLLADMLRLKSGDLVFFYIEGRGTKKGRFFGVFKAVDDVVYHIKGEKAKQPGLSLKLIYRKKIEPYCVYKNGILEWVALDKLPVYSRELLWNLIYRKMKGKRGNTMLFPWEAERLLSLIRDVNGGKTLKGDGFSFDRDSYTIKTIKKAKNLDKCDMGKKISLNLKDAKRSETHFQAFLLHHLKIGGNSFHPEIFGGNLAWIGNEVFAGSSMQKIDLMTIEKGDEGEVFRIIELKHPKARSVSGKLNSAPEQLRYYINWAIDEYGGGRHIIGSRKYNLKPILLVLVKEFGTIPFDVINGVKKISEMAEVWEMRYDGEVKLL